MIRCIYVYIRCYIKTVMHRYIHTCVHGNYKMYKTKKEKKNGKKRRKLRRAERTPPSMPH